MSNDCTPGKVLLGYKAAGTSARNQKKSGWASGKPGNEPKADQAGSRSASPFSGYLGGTGSRVGSAVSDENRCSLGLNVGHGGGAGEREREGREPQPATGSVHRPSSLHFLSQECPSAQQGEKEWRDGSPVPLTSFSSHPHFAIRISFSPRAPF